MKEHDHVNVEHQYTAEELIDRIESSTDEDLRHSFWRYLCRRHENVVDYQVQLNTQDRIRLVKLWRQEQKKPRVRSPFETGIPIISRILCDKESIGAMLVPMMLESPEDTSRMFSQLRNYIIHAREYSWIPSGAGGQIMSGFKKWARGLLSDLDAAAAEAGLDLSNQNHDQSPAGSKPSEATVDPDTKPQAQQAVYARGSGVGAPELLRALWSTEAIEASRSWPMPISNGGQEETGLHLHRSEYAIGLFSEEICHVSHADPEYDDEYYCLMCRVKVKVTTDQSGKLVFEHDELDAGKTVTPQMHLCLLIDEYELLLRQAQESGGISGSAEKLPELFDTNANYYETNSDGEKGFFWVGATEALYRVDLLGIAGFNFTEHFHNFDPEWRDFLESKTDAIVNFVEEVDIGPHNSDTYYDVIIEDPAMFASQVRAAILEQLREDW